jgi:hypothetical protein
LGIRQSEPIHNRKLYPGLEELSTAESAKINGGASLWFWIGYGIGYIGLSTSPSSGQPTTDHSAMSKALG